MVILSVKGTAKSCGVVEEHLVSLLLVRGSLREGHLGSDATSEMLELVVQVLFIFGESLNVTSNSFLLLVEGFEGDVVLIGVFSECVFEVLSEALEELDESFDGTTVGIVLGDLGEGGHNCGEGLNLLEGNGVLDHSG